MIEVEKLCLRQGAFALNEVSFQLPSAAHGVLMGKTGSGKTTILEAICGLRPTCGGRILLDGRDVTRLKPARRGIGYVPQDGALFAAMPVREQLAFSLLIRHWKRSAIQARVAELAELLGIGPLLERGPERLSGGEQQRVAMGRALASSPGILCLDEPLSALDEDAREEMCALLRTVRKATGVTILHVTHSHSEAEKVADRIFHLRDGRVRIVECGAEGAPDRETPEHAGRTESPDAPPPPAAHGFRTSPAS